MDQGHPEGNAEDYDEPHSDHRVILDTENADESEDLLHAERDLDALPNRDRGQRSWVVEKHHKQRDAENSGRAHEPHKRQNRHGQDWPGGNQ